MSVKQGHSGSSRQRVRIPRRQPYAWLGAGTLALGVGAALASGSGIAYADTAPTTSETSTGTTSGAVTAAAPTGTSSSLRRATAGTRVTQDASPAENSTRSIAVQKAGSQRTGVPPAGNSVRAAATSNYPITSAVIVESPGSGTTTTSPSTFAAVTSKSARSVPLTVSSIVGLAEQTPIGQVRTAVARVISPLTITSLPVASTAAVTVSGTPSAAATVAAAAAWSPSPLASIAKAVVGLLLSLGGMNAANPTPTTPLQQFLFSWAKQLNDSFDPAPPPGTPTVGTPDLNTGVVTGSLGFPTGGGLTFTATQPSQGSVVVDSISGTYTYTPTQAARQAATATTTDVFTATVHEGLSTNSVTVSVPVDPGTPVAGTPTVGTPDASTGVVTGAAVFTDPVGRTLSYSAATTSTAGGTVSIDAITGAFTYTPSLAARNASATTGVNVDTFTVTANNGVRSATETVAVAVVPNAAYVTLNLAWDPNSAAYWPSDIRSALQSAANYVASYFLISSSVTITIDVLGDSSGGVYAQPAGSFRNSRWETAAQTIILTGVDVNGSDAEGQIVFGYFPDLSAFTANYQGVLMHEVMHILGWGPSEAYTSFLTDINGNHVAIGDATYTANLTGGNGGLYFGGPNAVAANGGLVKVYTPSTWDPGGSLVHLDFNDPLSRLMNPNPGNPPARVLTPTELGVLEDIGYSVVPQPALAG